MYPDCYDYYPDDVDVDGPDTETCPVCGNDMEHEDVGIGSYDYGSAHGYDSRIVSWCPYCEEPLDTHIDKVLEYIHKNAPKEIQSSWDKVLDALESYRGGDEK